MQRSASLSIVKMHFPSDLSSEYIFPRLSAMDFIRFSQTDKLNHFSVSEYNIYAFSLTKILGRYFTPDQITQFRIVQAQTGTIISGSTALQFFDRAYYPESDLDLYVQDGNAKPLIDWLIGIGYSYQTEKDLDVKNGNDSDPFRLSTNASFWATPVKAVTANRTGIFTDPKVWDYEGLASEIEEVHTFLKSDSQAGDGVKKIQVVTAVNSPCEVILRFHSTAVMNFITHDTAYSLFPYATFEERRSLINNWTASANVKNHTNALEKYRRRGWTDIHPRMVQRDHKSDFYCPHVRDRDQMAGIRYIGDNRCWKIQLSPKMAMEDQLKVKQAQDLYRYTNSWKLDLYDHNSVTAFEVLVSPTLENRYVVAKPLVQFLRPIVKRMEEDKRERCDRGLQDLLEAYYGLVLN